MIIREWAVAHSIHVENFENPWIFIYGGNRISWCPITKDLRHWESRVGGLSCGHWGREQHAATWEDAKAIIHTAWGLESLGPPLHSA